MARRATVFKKQEEAKGQGALLKVAGFYEMLRPGQDSASAKDLATLQKVFRTLDYDLAVARSSTAKQLRAADLELPSGWMSLEQEIHSRVFSIGKAKVGFMVFPPLQEEDPDFSSIASLSRKMGSGLSLLVGVSPWGASLEKEFLQSRPDAVDILLGSGSGPSFKEKYPASGKTLWIRPYPQGKAVQRIHLPSLGREALQESRKPGENCFVQLIALDGNIPKNPSIKELMQ